MDVILNNILTVSYLLLWLITLIWYQSRVRLWDGGSAVFCTYILYAFFSILTINDPLFSSTFNPLRVFPYIYLYLMMMIALTPIIYNHFNPSNIIEAPNTRILKILAIILVICAFVLIPDIINHFGDGLVKLFTDSDAGKDAYTEKIEEAGDAGSGISNIPSIINNAFSDITIFLCFYFMSIEKKDIILIISLWGAIIVNILLPIMGGLRGGAIISLFTAVGGYMLFRCYLSVKINRIIQFIGILCVILITLPIAAITVSRFGDRSAGVSGFLNWYIGQGSLYFNNYGLDAGGTRNGDRTFNLLKRVVDSDTPKNYIERRDKYHNLKIDDHLFTTFVGDFTIDFGPIPAVFIFIVFNMWILSQIRPRGDSIKLHQLLLLYFTLCVSMQGGMSLYYYADTGNLHIVAFILVYAYLRYHEVLLEKYPIKKNSNKM